MTATLVVARSGSVLPLPPAALRFMGEDDERLLRVGDELAGLLVAHGMGPDSVVLDVGCGYGRLALGILHSTDHRGPYLGFDILRRQIDWCRHSISPTFPNVQFAHLDIRNDRYNPLGVIDPTETSFPARSASTDVAAVFSVFTHLYRADIERYLQEIRRTLRPGGVAVTTWFVFEDERLAQIASPASMYPMVHVLDDETRYSDPTDPLRAIAYRERTMRSMAAAAGLQVESVALGSWAGEAGATHQDLVILRRFATDTIVDPEPEAPDFGQRVSRARRHMMALVGRPRSRLRKQLGRMRRRLAPRRGRA